MAKKIKTFSTQEFLGEFMQPDPRLQQIIRQDYGKFFIVPVQDLIKVSKVPIPPTRATTHTLIYLTSGVATMKIGFQPVEIHQHECLVVPAGQVFSYDQYEVNQGFIINFAPDFLLGRIGSNDLLKDFEFLAIWGNPVIKPDRRTASYLTQTLQRVFDEYLAHGLIHLPVLQSYFIAALCDLNTAYQPLMKHESKAAVSLTNRFKELLHHHIKTKHLVTDYASLLNVSPNHLNKTLKTVTGKSTSKWIDEALIAEAKVLLFQTNYPISEIAGNLSIYDSSYFSRLFKRHEGVTPQEFRKMIEMS